MASGRRSGDPKDLILVDPSRPDATKRARKHLTKRQKYIFIQYGFSKALLQEVIGAGWDQADINNYVLYYNGRVEAALAVPAPGLDMSMKRAINTIIRTKLQAQEEGQEEEQEAEREIGLVTPVNPRGPSTGEPPEPDPGMLPPRTKKNSWWGAQTQYQCTIETQAQCTVSKRSTRRVEESAGKEEGGRAQEGSSQGSKEKWEEGSKRWSKEALQISAGNCCPQADQTISENHRTFDQEAALSAVGTRDCR